MKEKYMVRLTKTEIENFKNVNFGEIKYMNYSSVENDARIEGHDILGIYGQNGSGKTAMIEALDILKSILRGDEIDYSEYEGLFGVEGTTKIASSFYIEHLDKKYKADYEAYLHKNEKEKKIQIFTEKISYWQRGKTWNNKKSVKISNPYYDIESILDKVTVDIEIEKIKDASELSFVKALDKIAIYCAQKNVSLFYNDFINKLYSDITEEDSEEFVLSEIIKALYDFGRLNFQVVKVNQLGAINNNVLIPVNIHSESENAIMQGCLPLFMNGHGEVPEHVFAELKRAVSAINVALKAIIPNLVIDVKQVSEEINKDGQKMIQVDAYSVRNGKRFLTKYESEGIKRIISLLNYLIAVYNYSEICLVVDELDSGIFEYLLGELLGVFYEEAKGQLIFTSHNLRVLEKLDKKNIICSTTNPYNRYIRLTGIEKNNNRRDFYIRALVLGGQKEVLYDDEDLQSIGYAFRRATKGENKVKLKFSQEFEERLRD